MPAAVIALVPAAPGFYGKLPARGDFIGRRLSRRFIDAWDGWLQESVYASRGALAERWLGLYLTGPIWRFALSPGACGPDAAAGVTIPSVDSVGRYFPLMVGAELGMDVDLAELVGGSAGWYGALEARSLATLDDGFVLESLDAAIDEQPCMARRSGAGDGTLPRPGRRFALGAEGAAPAPALDLLRRAGDRVTVWWTDGSEQVAPCCLVCPGMPAAAAFASMLDGDFAARGWTIAEPDPQDGKE